MMDAFTGHYAAYILPAWGLSILALAWMTASSLVSAYRWRKAALERELPAKATSTSAVAAKGKIK